MRFFDSDAAQRIEFGRRLDALGDDPAAGIAGEGDQRRGERLARRVQVDVARERHIEFDQIRTDLKDVLQAGITCTGVVDREPHAVLPQGLKGTKQRVIIFDMGVLGDFQNDTFGRHSGKQVQQISTQNRFRRYVHRDINVRRKRFQCCQTALDRRQFKHFV